MMIVRRMRITTCPRLGEGSMTNTAATAQTNYLTRLVEADREFSASLQHLRDLRRRLDAAHRGLAQPGRRSALGLAHLARIELEHDAALGRLRDARRNAHRLLRLATIGAPPARPGLCSA
jgi:hypothetical protein